MHVLGVAGGQQQGQHGAGRQAADDDDVAFLAEAGEGLLGAGVPVLPGGFLDVGLGAAVTGQLRAVDGEAGASQAVGDEAHLGRGAAQAMHQEHPGPAARHVVALVLDGHVTPPCFEFRYWDPMRGAARPLFREEQGDVIEPRRRLS